MKLELRIDQTDFDAANQLVHAMEHHRIVQERFAINVRGAAPDADDDRIWRAFMVCLLTSQQRSDDDSPIGRVLNAIPFPLTLELCRSEPPSFISQVLKNSSGIRFIERIPNNATFNLKELDGGEWDELRQWERRLREQLALPPIPQHYSLERQAARYMDETFKGFGPKQSRNFWQMLGLTRYEFVLDSRVMNWLRELDASFIIPGDALADEDFYAWLSDRLREDLCVPVGILPCVLDAAIFSRPQPKRRRNKKSSRRESN